MRHAFRVASGLVLGLLLLAQAADAQWYYPRGYGGYGWGGWGADPASGYMAGLGSFARGQGAYEVDDARASAINLETMLRWNQALRAQQKEFRAEQRKSNAEKQAELAERAEQLNLRDGTTLNDLLMAIYDFDPSLSNSSRAKTPISASAIREIPFESDSEAITFCIDQMTGRDSLPPALMDPKFVEQRNALEKAVDEALKEDAKGSVSRKTQKRVNDAIADLRAKFSKAVPEYDPNYLEADSFLTTLSSLTRMLNDPSMGKVLGQLENYQNATIGDLITFMHLYNLRFGPATSDRQIRIYESLAPMLAAIQKESAASPKPDRDSAPQSKDLPAAARSAFKGMNWKQLNGQDRQP